MPLAASADGRAKVERDEPPKDSGGCGGTPERTSGSPEHEEHASQLQRLEAKGHGTYRDGYGGGVRGSTSRAVVWQ